MLKSQDSYSSEEEDDMLCPLCMEEIDISDKNFKPCQCGYRVCRFCWHHIKEDLNGRCPACRRLYTEENVQWRPVTAEEWKMDLHRKNERKKREKERKEVEASNRKHLANIRVVQKNLAYVNGLSPKIANEDNIHILKGLDYFGQYGKIIKIAINKKAAANSANGHVGVYITYQRKEDAARAIAAIDGSISDGRHLRASYGTTKYCTSYLRNQQCPNPSCMYLHEPGDEVDSYTKEDLASLQHSRNLPGKVNGIATANHSPSPSLHFKTPLLPINKPLVDGGPNASDEHHHSGQPSVPHPSSNVAAPYSSAAAANVTPGHTTTILHHEESSALPPTASWAKLSPTVLQERLRAAVNQQPLDPLKSPSLSSHLPTVQQLRSVKLPSQKENRARWLDVAIRDLATPFSQTTFNTNGLGFSDDDLEKIKSFPPLFVFNARSVINKQLGQDLQTLNENTAQRENELAQVMPPPGF
ncbi:CCR4-Not complex ubiquitin-protein ligase E3 subunit 4 [Schizosaccharomyces osmophilus]|uniref:CCR4-Not complex ubiquitin-protein ligase E3 subunit 4 n=1 Tax=Schizosaccharomyces osmophilus TaxID=2545709 RepID=A0AAE9W906_9SCHI|nr:CCR4-Not complex ubiquitin-protein ligase E3 subunit 4 [Schizosaccharomyces osmophilus]WBW71037.1 CCR4-Not complex ubiquitin-protein ligase E3 subunit 4 [Schizosaccharomyces osmophilus]